MKQVQRQHAKRWIGLSLILSMVLAAPVSAQTKLGIAAIVNDSIITTHDIDARVKLLGAMSATNDPAAQKRLRAQAMQLLINETLQQQEAKRLSISVSKKQLEAAIAAIEKQRGKPPGSLRAFLKKNNIEESTMLSQVRTQVAWNEIVTRRLRRNITVTEDEVVRAQQAVANSPGKMHVRIAAISLPIAGPNDESRVAKLAEALLQRIAVGASFQSVAREVATRPDVKLNPSVWIAEDALEPSISSALRGLQVGEVTKPLRSLNTYQLVQLQDRRTMQPPSPKTEVVLKETILALKPNAKAQEVDALMEVAMAIRQNPGGCEDTNVAGIEGLETVNIRTDFMRTTLEKLTPGVVPLVHALSVGEVAEPFATPQGIKLLMLCEKIEAPTMLPDRKLVEQQLFGERMELEAAKHMRNLRRDAFIEINEPS